MHPLAERMTAALRKEVDAAGLDETMAQIALAGALRAVAQEVIAAAAETPARYTMHHDAGHAWLAVPVAHLATIFRIDPSMPWPSRFSYISRDSLTAYLEEDCDAPAYMTHATAAGLKATISHAEHDTDAFIRRLPSMPAMDR